MRKHTSTILLTLVAALTACGGGGDFDEVDQHYPEKSPREREIAPPSCKHIPPEQREAECGT